VLFALGVLVFGAAFPSANLAGAFSAIVLGIAAHLGFGILSASFVIVFKRGDPVSWAIDALTFLVAGIFYPVEVLPATLQPVASLLPATHALRALRRSLLQGAGPAELASELGLLAFFAALLLLLSGFSLRIALKKATRDGTLGQA
jgi:ABC-2 type transport system permease protein